MRMPWYSGEQPLRSLIQMCVVITLSMSIWLLSILIGPLIVGPVVQAHDFEHRTFEVQELGSVRERKLVRETIYSLYRINNKVTLCRHSPYPSRQMWCREVIGPFNPDYFQQRVQLTKEHPLV